MKFKGYLGLEKNVLKVSNIYGRSDNVGHEARIPPPLHPDTLGLYLVTIGKVSSEEGRLKMLMDE